MKIRGQRQNGMWRDMEERRRVFLEHCERGDGGREAERVGIGP